MTTAFLTSELLKMLRRDWRWAGHLIHTPVPPTPAAALFPTPCWFSARDVWTAEVEELEGKKKISHVFFSSQHSKLTAEVMVGRTGDWADPAVTMGTSWDQQIQLSGSSSRRADVKQNSLSVPHEKFNTEEQLKLGKGERQSHTALWCSQQTQMCDTYQENWLHRWEVQRVQ